MALLMALPVSAQVYEENVADGSDFQESPQPTAPALPKVQQKVSNLELLAANLNRAKLKLKHVDQLIADRENDNVVMDGLMPIHDPYNESYYQPNIEQSQNLLLKLKAIRRKLAVSIAYYEQKYFTDKTPQDPEMQSPEKSRSHSMTQASPLNNTNLRSPGARGLAYQKYTRQRAQLRTD